MTPVSLPYVPTNADPRDVEALLGNFNAILAVLNGDVRDDNISGAAAIEYSKLALTGKIRNVDIAAAAALAVSKLAAGPEGYVLKIVSGVPTWVRSATTVYKNTTPGGTGGTSLVDLQTVTIPAASLAVGDVIDIYCGGSVTGSANNKSFSLLFGAQEITGATWSAGSLGDWSIHAKVVVTGASAQVANGSLVGTGHATDVESVSPTEAISGAITVKMKGQTSAAGDELTSNLLVVQVIPA